jgi:hypothetical protein
MQRSGPLFAKAWDSGKAPTPRGQNRGSNPQHGPGIVERIKHARKYDERMSLLDKARAFVFISPRTLRRAKQAAHA